MKWFAVLGLSVFFLYNVSARAEGQSGTCPEPTASHLAVAILMTSDEADASMFRGLVYYQGYSITAVTSKCISAEQNEFSITAEIPGTQFKSKLIITQKKRPDTTKPLGYSFVYSTAREEQCEGCK